MGDTHYDHKGSRRSCFVGYSLQVMWQEDLLIACNKVLPQFHLQPWYAADHFEPTKTLRNKVVELIVNARYGIYDLSSWQNRGGSWQQPRNVFIELGMAIALNRPTLLLRHTSNQSLPLPGCFEGLELIEFAGETTLIKTLQARLPHWVNVPPEQDWWNRFCIFGNRKCSFREAHPRAQQALRERLMCHVTDGLDETLVTFRQAERSEIRACFESTFERYEDVHYNFLDELSLAEGYQFRLCSHCQSVRSTPFAVYHITPQTPAEVYITLGMSIALEKVFDYEIPKILLVRRESDLPSLLRGYDVVEVGSSSEMTKKLKAFVPTVIKQVRETVWVARPLPFVEHQTPSTEGINTAEDTNNSKSIFNLEAFSMFHDALQEVVAKAIKLFDCDVATMYVYDHESSNLREMVTYDSLLEPREPIIYESVHQDSIVFKILERDGVYLADDVMADPLLKNSRFIQQEAIKSCVAIPFTLVDGLETSILFLSYRSKQTNSNLSGVSNRITQFVQEATMFLKRAHQSLKLGEILEFLHDVEGQLDRMLYRDEILAFVAEQATRIIGLLQKREVFISIWIVTQSEFAVELVAAYPLEKLSEIQTSLEKRILQEEDIVVHSIRTGLPIVAIDVLKTNYSTSLRSKLKTRSELVVPLKVAKNVIGVINASSQSVGGFTQLEHKALELLAERVAGTVANAQR